MKLPSFDKDLLSFKKKKKEEETPVESAEAESADLEYPEDAPLVQGTPVDPEKLHGPFDLPSLFLQYKACYMVQMKRFSKSKVAVMLPILIILIPVMAYLLNAKAITIFGSGITNQGMCICLLLLPLMSMFLSALLCGTMLPSEYRERTVYLSLPLPMPRSAFYFGKFLAGLTLSFGTVLGAYGVAILISLSQTSGAETYMMPILKSLGLALCGCFFFCALTYGMSAKAKRSSTMKAFILMFIVVPIVAVIVPYLSDYLPKGLVDFLSAVVHSLPVFLPDISIYTLGSPSLCMLMPGSVAGFMSDMMMKPFAYGSTSSMVILAIVLGCCALAGGYNKIKRRDM